MGKKAYIFICVIAVAIIISCLIGYKIYEKNENDDISGCDGPVYGQISGTIEEINMEACNFILKCEEKSLLFTSKTVTVFFDDTPEKNILESLEINQKITVDFWVEDIEENTVQADQIKSGNLEENFLKDFD